VYHFPICRPLFTFLPGPPGTSRTLSQFPKLSPRQLQFMKICVWPGWKRRGGHNKDSKDSKDSGLSAQNSRVGPAHSLTPSSSSPCTCFDLFGIITDAYRSYYSLLKLLTLDNKNCYLNSTRKVHTPHRISLAVGKLQFVQIFMYIENYSFV